MSSIEGLGWWSAFHNAIDPGGQAIDIERGIQVCRSTGASWVCFRFGAGGLNDVALAPQMPDGSRRINVEILRAYKEAGIKVYGWIFSYVRTWRAEVEAYRKIAATGLIEGVIVNAEFDWEEKRASYGEAEAFVSELRKALPAGMHVGHAPPDYLGARGGDNGKHRCWDAFDDLCDSIHPQTYAYEHDDRGHVYHIDRVCAQYEKRGYAAKVCPILCSYRPNVRGYTIENKAKGVVGGKPIPTPPLANEALTVAADLVAGLNDLRVIAAPASSIYSIDALNFIKRGVGDVVLATLQARWAERIPPVVPLAPATPPPEPEKLPVVAEVVPSPASPLAASSGDAGASKKGCSWSGAYRFVASIFDDDDDPPTTPSSPEGKRKSGEHVFDLTPKG